MRCSVNATGASRRVSSHRTTNMPRRRRWPNAASLRGRYLYFALALSAVLALAAGLGWRYADTQTTRHIAHIQERAEASDAVADVVEQSRTLEVSLQRFIIFPSDENQTAVERAFVLQQAAIRRLRASGWVTDDPTFGELIAGLAHDTKRLSENVAQLVRVRLDQEEWFPATAIMQQRMLPRSVEFNTNLELALKEVFDNLDQPGNIELYTLLNETRYTWLRLISEFRLYVANRLGVFTTEAESGMQARRQNIEVYAQHVDELLARIAALEARRNIELLTAQSFATMREWQSEWRAGYMDVVELLNSARWREDLRLLQDTVSPLLTQIRQRLSTLQLELGIASAKDITTLSKLAQFLSQLIVVLAVAGILVVGAGYSIFHRVLLKPIAQVANALEAEAHGRDLPRVPDTGVEEIRQLSHAFEQMREQVHSRQARLDHMAHHDALTGLPNRVLLRDRLAQALARCRRSGSMVGLMFLDLDRFKQINDSLGHDIGDQLLQEAARRLGENTRASDTVARLGGDEFAIVVESVSSADQISTLAHKVREAFVRPFLLAGRELHLSTSIGIAVGPDDGTNVDTLVKNADIAMYHAKEGGRNRYEFFSADMSARVAAHLALEMELRWALERDEFRVHYQPIIDMQSGAVVSAEALLRWEHPQRGLLHPAEFLPILEETGLIEPVTRWVLQEVGRQRRICQQAGFGQLKLAVNLSGTLFRRQVIFELVEPLLRGDEQGVIDLVVEVTEDTLIEDLQAARATLQNLKGLGIQIALDDFGTRQSSLSHLRRSPIDIVKIDGDFVRDVATDTADAELVAAIIAMARSLRIKVVAEGVETAAQLQFLTLHDCDAFQGYLVSKPLAPEALLEFLARTEGYWSAELRRAGQGRTG